MVDGYCLHESFSGMVVICSSFSQKLSRFRANKPQACIATTLPASLPENPYNHKSPFLRLMISFRSFLAVPKAWQTTQNTLLLDILRHLGSFLESIWTWRFHGRRIGRRRRIRGFGGVAAQPPLLGREAIVQNILKELTAQVVGPN